MKLLDWSIAKLAIPLILSGMTAPLLGLINVAVLGHLEHNAYLAAVGFGEMIFGFVYWLFNFLRMGTTGLASQVAKHDDQQPFQDICWHSILLAVFLSAILLALQVGILDVTFWISSPQSAIAPLVKTYFYIRIWALPAALLQFVFTGILISLVRTRLVLLLTFIVNVSAAFFCVLFVFVFHWNVAGVAFADVIGQYLGLAVGAYCLLRLNILRFKSIQIRWSLFVKLISVNASLFIRTLCLIISFSFFTIKSNHLGVLILAANNLLQTLQIFASNVLDGFVGVTESKIGHAVGSGSRSALKLAIKQTFVWTIIAGALLSAIFGVLGPMFIHWLTNLPDVRIMANHYLLFLIISPVIGMLSFFFDGVFIGINAFKDMRNMMVLAMIIYFIVWYFTQSYGNTGLWIALSSFFAARSVLMTARYFSLKQTKL